MPRQFARLFAACAILAAVQNISAAETCDAELSAVKAAAEAVKNAADANKSAADTSLRNAIVTAFGCLVQKESTGTQAQIALARLSARTEAVAIIGRVLGQQTTPEAAKTQALEVLRDLAARPQRLIDEAYKLLGQDPKGEFKDLSEDVRLERAKALCDAAKNDDSTTRALNCLGIVTSRQKAALALASARTRLAQGSRDAAIQTLRSVVDSAAPPERDKAQKILDDAQWSFGRQVAERLRAPWVYDLLAGIAVAAAFYFLVLGVRRLKVAIELRRIQGKHRPWVLAPITEDGGSSSAQPT